MKALLAQKLPRNVWFLGFVSLLTDVNSKMVQSILPLFLVSVLEDVRMRRHVNIKTLKTASP